MIFAQLDIVLGVRKRRVEVSSSGLRDHGSKDREMGHVSGRRKGNVLDGIGKGG